MRKLLLFLCALLGMSSAYAIEVKIAKTTEGLPSTFGTFKENTFTTNDASGLAGVVVTADTEGLNILEQSVSTEAAGYGNCFAFKTAKQDVPYKVTITAPDGYVVAGYSLDGSANTSGAPHTLTSASGLDMVEISSPPYNTPNGPMTFAVSDLSDKTTWFTISTANKGNVLYVPYFTILVIPEGSSVVKVTYELYESDGITLVSSKEVEQEANSAVEVPEAFTGVPYFDYVTSGTIGNSDCTIKVTRTVKSTVVSKIEDLSNNKVYRVWCKRGYLSTYNGTTLASTVKSGLGVSAANFAFINNDSKLYLFSEADSKFVLPNGTLDTYPNEAELTITPLDFPFFAMLYAENYVNTSAGYDYGFVINSWGGEGKWDVGNQYVIMEAGDFDTDALAGALDKFTDLTPYFDALNEAIATAEAIPFGTEVNEYTKGEGFDDALADAKAVAANSGATKDELVSAAKNLLAAIDGCTLNLPTVGGFYRIKGKTSGLYLAAGMASNGKFNMTDAMDNTTLFYYYDNGSTKGLANVATGLSARVMSSVWAWSTEDMSPVVVFQDGLYNRGYAILSGDINLYDNGDNSGSADRGKGVELSASTNARYCSWELEAVTDVTKSVEVTDAGYATFYFPVAVTVPEGVKAYTGIISGSSLVLTSVGDKIPANTAVVLKAEAGTYDFVSTTAASFAGTNNLEGTVGGKTTASGTILTLQNKSTVGFYPYGNEDPRIDLVGFKAYIEQPAEEVKGLTFDLETAIRTIEAEKENAVVYNLAGQRVAKAQKGIYIVSGKKMVK